VPANVTDVLLALVIVAVPIDVIVVPPVMRLTVKTDEAVTFVVSYAVAPAKDAGTTRDIAIGTLTIAPAPGFPGKGKAIGTNATSGGS
jgi:hypothetical protein